ncbi:MAG: Na(+)-translocating NADH-quinone reductase subunit A [Bacteroidia bacterium]|nr:Na(+)-translocating NADH-quinone reductase subunit A [Bacteroidia bacterium]
MSQNFVLKKGLNIPVKGISELRISNAKTPDIVAVKPTDFKGLAPRLLVREGDSVLCGSPVIADKAHAEILLTSPVSGKVKTILRGDKRKLLAVLIENDHDFNCVEFKAPTTAEEVKQTILASGMWPWLVQRPYGVIANPELTPKGIFVSGFNTAPLAADVDFCFADQFKFIQAAVSALATLAPVHVSLDAENPEAAKLNKLENCTLHYFQGKHPAGNVGVQISHISPIQKEETVWTISLLGLAAIGKVLVNKKVDLTRKVAVCGPMAIDPSYIVTMPGLPMKDITGQWGTLADEARVVSGDMLSGAAIGPEGYLGFFDNQVTVIKEGREKEAFGWIRPIRYKQFSTDHSYFSWLMPWRKYNLDTNLHGGPRAFLMNDAYYAKVLPMDIYPLYLTKACLAGDIDKMEKFGIYEVLPEDLALCEFVDPSKNYIQDIIAKGIDLMLKEMA